MQVVALAGAMLDGYRAAVLIAAWSGPRPGEVFALHRGDLDLSAATVTVSRTLVEVPGQPIAYGPPKSAAGSRTVNLPRSILPLLSASASRTACGVRIASLGRLSMSSESSR
ncbi:hypothetical protein [Brevibacterium aurantiacum]|uniref:hypothetical protein n=1 Tax=Brevibacterium aurantiacum TaxID=273384 RepID=UPI0011AF6DFC|nr:hypothetical protein [Brevibacterium aurantiacum]